MDITEEDGAILLEKSSGSKANQEEEIETSEEDEKTILEEVVSGSCSHVADNQAEEKIKTLGEDEKKISEDVISGSCSNVADDQAEVKEDEKKTKRKPRKKFARRKLVKKPKQTKKKTKKKSTSASLNVPEIRPADPLLVDCLFSDDEEKEEYIKDINAVKQKQSLADKPQERSRPSSACSSGRLSSEGLSILDQVSDQPESVSSLIPNDDPPLEEMDQELCFNLGSPSSSAIFSELVPLKGSSSKTILVQNAPVESEMPSSPPFPASNTSHLLQTLGHMGLGNPDSPVPRRLTWS